MKTAPKFLLTVVLSVAMICSTGCEKVTLTPIYTNFRCNGTANLLQTEVSFEMSVQDGEIFSLTVTAPSSLSGLTFNYNGDQKEIVFGEIKVDGQKNLPEGNFADLIRLSLQDARKNEICPTAKDLSVQGSVVGEAYELTFRPDGFITQLCLEKKDVKVNFTNFEYI